MLYHMLSNNQLTIQTLVNQHNEFRGMLLDQSTRLSNLESFVEISTGNAKSEISQLKELRRRGESTPEIKVNGVPANTTVSHTNLANKILEVFGLNTLCSDILSVLKIKPKIASQDTSGSAGTSTSKTNTGNKPQKPLISLVIKLKSNIIRQHILQAKRLHGVIKLVEDLVEDGPDNVVSLYEIVPPLLNDLRLLAKEKATQLGYKYTWVSTVIF